MGNPEERDLSEDRVVDGRMDLREISWGGVVEWIQLAPDRDRWWCEHGAGDLRVLAPRSWLVS
jgi:hypothetical protein